MFFWPFRLEQLREKFGWEAELQSLCASCFALLSMFYWCGKIFPTWKKIVWQETATNWLQNSLKWVLTGILTVYRFEMMYLSSRHFNFTISKREMRHAANDRKRSDHFSSLVFLHEEVRFGKLGWWHWSIIKKYISLFGWSHLIPWGPWLSKQPLVESKFVLKLRKTMFNLQMGNMAHHPKRSQGPGHHLTLRACLHEEVLFGKFGCGDWSWKTVDDGFPGIKMIYHVEWNCWIIFLGGEFKLHVVDWRT